MKNKKKGFTLVELLAVLVVLGIVMILVAPTAMSAFYKARASLSEMEQGVVIDAVKIYLTDLDKGKVKYTYEGSNPIEVNGHKYQKGDALSGYDLRVYLMNPDGIYDTFKVDIRTLVEGGYYDDKCTYDKETGKPGKGCRIQEECVLTGKITYKKSPDGAFYIGTGYEAEIETGCTK